MEAKENVEMEAAEMEDEELLESEDSDTPVKMMLGWRIAYRTQKPEHPNVDQLVERLKRKSVAFKNVIATLPAARRTEPFYWSAEAKQRNKERRRLEV